MFLNTPLAWILGRIFSKMAKRADKCKHCMLLGQGLYYQNTNFRTDMLETMEVMTSTTRLQHIPEPSLLWILFPKVTAREISGISGTVIILLFSKLKYYTRLNWIWYNQENLSVEMLYLFYNLGSSTSAWFTRAGTLVIWIWANDKMADCFLKIKKINPPLSFFFS